MLPKLTQRKRTGVNRLFRWHSNGVVSVAPTDPVHLTSCVLDLWYTSGVVVSGSEVSTWANIASNTDPITGIPNAIGVASDATPALKPLFYSGAGVGDSSVGTSAGGSFAFSSNSLTLTGAFTAYWLADYAGTLGIPLGHVSGKSALWIDGTTAYISNKTPTTVSKDGTLNGNRLYRWRRTSANACYFKPGNGSEVSMGTLSGDLVFLAALQRNNSGTFVYDDTDNRTRRILLYNTDLVENGTNAPVEAAINDISNNTNVTIFTTGQSGNWTIPADADLSKAVTFTAISAGGKGGTAGTNSGGGGGGGGAWGGVTLTSPTAGSFIAGSKFAITIADPVVVADPNSKTLISCTSGGAGGDGSGGTGGTGGAAGVATASTPAAYYIAPVANNGGKGGAGATRDHGGGGGGGSGGFLNIGITGNPGYSLGDGAGGGAAYAGGHGESGDSTGDGKAGTSPGGGGGGGGVNTNAGAGLAGGDASVRVSYYINATTAPYSGSTNPSEFTQCKLDLPWVAASILKTGGAQAANGDHVETWDGADTGDNDGTGGSGTQPSLNTTNGIYDNEPGGAARLTLDTAITLTGDLTLEILLTLPVTSSMNVFGNSAADGDGVFLSGDGDLFVIIAFNGGASVRTVPLPSFAGGAMQIRIRRSGSSWFAAMTGLAEVAMTAASGVGTGNVVLDTILAFRFAGSIDQFSQSDCYVKWLAVFDESVTPLTTNERAAIETYMSGAALT
jgi:hypothetical protein